MGTMNRIRENTGVILWILVFAFGVIWVLQDSGGLDVIGGTRLNEFIVVDGDAISYDEFNRALEAQIESYRQQTGESMPPQRVDLEQDRVFEQLVENKLREHEMKRLGITVSDQEVREMVLGADPHPIIKVYFGDGQGGVDQALLQNFIDDPEAEEQWIQLEAYLRAERSRQKLDNLIAATVRVTDRDVEQEYRKRNLSANAQYFALRYADLPDDSVEVAQRDLKRFYDDHRDEFKRNRAYTIKVATVSKLPTREDTLSTLEDLAKLRTSFAEADDDSLFLSRYGSERPYTSAFFSRADLDEPIAQAVFADPTAGTVVGPVVSGDEVHLIKIEEVRPVEETTVRARHLLIRAPEGNPDQRAEARRKIEDIQRRLRQGEDFAALAGELSEDPGSGAQGGDLGWFGPGRMVEPFQRAAFAAPVGRVVGPVETEFGYHLIEVTDRARFDVRIADYAQKLRASASTVSSAQERLEDLQYYGEESGDFEGEARKLGLELREIQVEQDQQSIPGLGNSRSLTQFLDKAEQGDVSKVIELNDVFVVAYVTAIQPEGYRPLAEVEAEIRPRVLLEKKKAVQRARMEAAYRKGGFDGLAQALGTTARSATGISFNNTLVPTLGRDAIFAGTLLGLKQGQDSGVVEGNTAVFVAKVTSVSQPPPMTDVQRDQLRQELLNRRRSQVQNRWIASLKEKATIKDQRALLLR